MFKVIGTVYKDGERRNICYADDFERYEDAYDYAKYLDNSNNWNNNNMPGQPTFITIEEY